MERPSRPYKKFVHKLQETVQRYKKSPAIWYKKGPSTLGQKREFFLKRPSIRYIGRF